MPATFLFELVSPEKLLFSDQVEQVTIPGEDGDFGVLAHHAPLISTVRPGVIRIHQNGRVAQTLFVSGGFAEVTPDRCTMLADAAEEVSKIDAAKAQAEYQQYLTTEAPTANRSPGKGDAAAQACHRAGSCRGGGSRDADEYPAAGACRGALRRVRRHKWERTYNASEIALPHSPLFLLRTSPSIKESPVCPSR